MNVKRITIHALIEQNNTKEQKENIGDSSATEIKSEERQVTIGYCFATELNYKLLSNEDINVFVVDAVTALQKNRMPDTQKTIYFILASILSYYDSIGEKAPITDRDLMFACTAEEIGIALGTVIGLRSDFYHIPSGEPEEKQNDEKNV